MSLYSKLVSVHYPENTNMACKTRCMASVELGIFADYETFPFNNKVLLSDLN